MGDTTRAEAARVASGVGWALCAMRRQGSPVGDRGTGTRTSPTSDTLSVMLARPTWSCPLPAALLVVGLALGSCVCEATIDGSATGDTAVVEGGGTIRISDANVAPIAIAVAAESFPIAVGDGVCVEWGSATRTPLGSPFEPSTIESAYLIRFGLGKAEVTERLATCSLMQTDATAGAIVETLGATDVCFTDLDWWAGAVGEPAWLACEDDTAWMVALFGPDGGSFYSAPFAFLDPCSGTGGDTVRLSDDGATVAVAAELESVDALTVHRDAPYTIDWSGVTETSSGESIAAGYSGSVVLAHLPFDELDDVERATADLISYTDVRFEGYASRTFALSLSETVSDDGEAFAGFSDDGTWLVSLDSELCPEWILTRVSVR